MKQMLVLALLIGITGCSSVQKQDLSSTDTSDDAPKVVAKNPDPWEGFNRQMYRFNDTLDRALLKPVAKGYKAITPDPIEHGVTNVFGNLSEVKTILNSMLQWKWGSAAHSTGRFVVNSTLGLVGIIDVAERIGLEKQDGEDFGQTLATWGVGSGPFLVLPLFGPSTVRDGVSSVVDWYADPITYVDHSETNFALKATRTIDTRAQLLEAEELISGDRYSFIRDAYLQRRAYLINDGQIEDDFGGDDDFGEDDAFDDIEF